MHSNSRVASFFIFIFVAFSSFSQEANNNVLKYDLFSKFPSAKIRAVPKNIFQLKSNFSYLKKEHIEDLVRQLTRATSPNRQVGTVGHLKFEKELREIIEAVDLAKSGMLFVDSFKPDTQKAIAYYENEFKEKIGPFHKKGSETYKQAKSFTDSMTSYLQSQKATMGKNIIWEKKGSLRPDELVVFSAHYDTLSLDENKTVQSSLRNPGADNNASGMASALALIKIFSHIDVPVTIRFVFYDWEEWGGLGSWAYLEKYRNEKKRVLAYINLESLGHDSKTQDKERRIGNMKVYVSKPDRPYFEKERQLTELLIEKGRKVLGQNIFKMVANDQLLEGQMGRWQDEVPSLTFSQNWQDDPNDQRIHGPNDFPETLNFNTLHRTTKFIGGGVLAYLYGF